MRVNVQMYVCEHLRRNWTDQICQKLINLIYFEINEFDIYAKQIFSLLKYKINY